MLDARYMPKVLDHAQSEEILVLCPFWDLAGSCGMRTRLDGRPYEDHGHNQFGSTEECETTTRNAGEYAVL